MINGEGIRGNASMTASPDRFGEFPRWVDQKPQVTNPSPDSSEDYSSCGESEFEKYCSANSVMGTPSMCGSVGTFSDFLDLDFVPGRASRVGEDGLGSRGEVARNSNSGDGSVSHSGAFDLFDGSAEFQNEDVASGDFMEERRNWSKSSPPASEEKSALHRTIFYENSDCSKVASEGENELVPSQSSNLITTYNDNISEELVASMVPEALDLSPISDENHATQVLGANEELHDCFYPFNVKESESPEEEETSYRYEQSDDDDDSMFNYGTDDERKMDSYNLRNIHCLQDTKDNDENPFLLGSTVGFGSKDWENFMQETENSVASLSMNKPIDKLQENPQKEGKLVKSIYEDPASASAPNKGGSEQTERMRNVPSTTCLANCREGSESCSTRNRLPTEDFIAEKASLNDNEAEREPLFRSMEKFVGYDADNTSENDILGKSKQPNVFPGTTVVQLGSSATAEPCGEEAVSFEDSKVQKSPPATEDRFDVGVKEKEKLSPALENLSKKHLAPIKVGNFELKESYDDLVLEMEEILLDSVETHGSRLPQNNRSPLPFRDGSSTASTSGTDDCYSIAQHPLKIDGVEVVGAKQMKGDVSLGERLVGVKEYTVYLLRAWSGKDHWQVERRYRDFFTLYRQMKTLYASHGCSLPTPWSRVEQESRKFFGNASPRVVSERSGLIQECLRSILHSGTPNGAPSTLNWFLSPQKAISSPSLLNTLVHQSTSAFTGGALTGDVPTFGKTISLLVEIQPRKSVKLLLEAQHYVCAGCHKQLDEEKNLMRGFVHTLGWGKPRLCEYTGQLFCASCHTNETAVLPARVLHFWDFTEYPVSQMAKSYLDSIYDQPMLCVSAINPFLFSKVKVLFHVMGIRKKIGAMMPYVRCPFRRSVHRAMGTRRYLIETNEFFALRDLVDLSKGAFSALPVMIETASTKVLNHITQQCLICCDVGVPCGARQACEDPSSLIFPFQEDEIKRCRSCESIFHKACFTKLSNCPCSVDYEVGNSARPAREVNHEPNNCSEASVTLARKPDFGSPVKFLSYLFKSRQEMGVKRKTSNPVILMGSLPSTFTNPL